MVLQSFFPSNLKLGGGMEKIGSRLSPPSPSISPRIERPSDNGKISLSCREQASGRAT